jgi:hypothetical protein
MSALSQLPIFIDDSGTITVTEIRSRCRRLQSGDGLAAVFIDYLQLVRPSTSGKQQNRNDELSDICRTLKATAKDLQIPIIALAQLPARSNKKPIRLRFSIGMRTIIPRVRSSRISRSSSSRRAVTGRRGRSSCGSSKSTRSSYRTATAGITPGRKSVGRPK